MTRTRHRFHYGPWPGGFNDVEDPARIADTQLAQLVNLDVKNDGILEPRAALRWLDGDPHWDYTGDYESGVTFSGNSTTRLLGQIIDTGGSYYHFYYLCQNSIRRASTDGLATIPFTGVVIDGNYLKAVEYNNFTYFINTASAKSFRTASPYSGGAVTLTPNFPAITLAYPYNFDAIIFKDRMFLFSTNRIYYSKVTDPTIWAAPDGGFFDVGSSKDPITSIEVSNDTLYIFKATRTWAFRFNSDPATDGTLQIITADKGATFTCVDENIIYTTDAYSVFRFQNGYYEDLALNIAKDANWDMHNQELFVWNNRLYVGMGGSYNLITGAWSKYDTSVWASVQGSIARALVHTGGSNGDYVVLQGSYGLYTLGYDLISGDNAPVFDSFPHPEGKKYIFPTVNVASKVLVFRDEYTWKKYLKSYINHGLGNTSATTTPSPKYEIIPLVKATLDEVQLPSYTYVNGLFDETGNLRNTKDKILHKMFRFTGLTLKYNYTDLVDGKFYTYNYRDPNDEINFVVGTIQYIKEFVIDFDMKAEVDR